VYRPGGYLVTEQRIATGFNVDRAERAQPEARMIEGRIADAEAHVDDLEALPPA